MKPVCTAWLVLILVISVCTVYADLPATIDPDTMPEITITTSDAGTISGLIIVSPAPVDPGVPDQTDPWTTPDIVSDSTAVVTVSMADTGQVTSPDQGYPQINDPGTLSPDNEDSVTISTVSTPGCCMEDARAFSALFPVVPFLQSSAFPRQDTVLVAINRTSGQNPVMVSMNSSFEGPGPGLFQSVTDLLVLDGNLTMVITASPPGREGHTIST